VRDSSGRSIWRSAYRLALTAAKAIAIVIAIVLLAAVAYEHIAAWRDSRVLKQVGRSVDIGGRSLNIHCIGDGSPTVVFVSARVAPGYVWTPVQRGVAAFTRACWYDRADLGWSDYGPAPVTGESAARDLHLLVEHAGIARPIVLAGHSFGGYVIRMFNDLYPGEVSGMVFVDSAHEDAGKVRGIPHRERPPIPDSVIRGLSTVGARLGVMRFMAADPGPPPKHWTAEEWDVLARLRRQRNVFVADGNMAPERVISDRVRSAGGLEDMPLIVLTQGNPQAVEASVLEGWAALQRQLAQRSRRGRHVLVPESGHGIPQEAPDAVVGAVRDIVTTVRQDARQSAR
jgi:pimeloyl-ACP methyl ester carboxylesterase